MDINQRTIEISKKYIDTSNRLSMELSQKQLDLRLEEIFFHESLASNSKRKESSLKLDELTELLESHKSIYSQLVPQFEKELSFRFDEYTDQERQAVLLKHKELLQYRVLEQYAFFENRKLWISHVRALLELFDSNPEDIFLSNGTVQIHDRIYDEYIKIDDKIREASERERQIGETRKKRMLENAAKIGIKFESF